MTQVTIPLRMRFPRLKNDLKKVIPNLRKTVEISVILVILNKRKIKLKFVKYDEAQLYSKRQQNKISHVKVSIHHF